MMTMAKQSISGRREGGFLENFYGGTMVSVWPNGL